MTAKLFIALSIGLVAGMMVLFFANFAAAWVFFAYIFLALFGGIVVSYRPWIIAAGFLAASLIVLGAGLFSAQRIARASAWPTASGVITRSYNCTRRVNGSVVYSGPCIDYRYRVNGQDYQVSSTDTREFARSGWLRIPDRFQEGREVEVHYDPGNPGISRLTTEIPLGDWITLAIGGGMAALSAFTLGWVLLHPQPAPAASLPATFPSRLAIPGSSPARSHKVDADLVDQLEKLAVLHKEQALTDEEYEQAKKKLLGEG